jgi:outer membrane protein assembly factor BamB
MNIRKKVLALAILVSLAQWGISQTPIYRYATMSNGNGSVFFALDGSTGQLRYMRDVGEAAGTWYSFGAPMRETGKNNLLFQAVAREKGFDFYALEANSGQLYWMSDFGEHPGAWHSYGTTIRNSDRPTLEFAAEPEASGNKFTAIDGDTGQIYFMFDFGDSAGIWKPYGNVIR